MKTYYYLRAGVDVLDGIAHTSKTGVGGELLPISQDE